jgi:hypothetical protein
MTAWVPFEERPRPDGDLKGVTIGIDRMKRIEITHPDEAALGRVFAWALGQIRLARRAEDERE